MNPEWRSGRALCDVFQFSVYPASESLRQWSKSPRVLFVMAWGVMIFELIFPLLLLSRISLIIALIIAAIFHFANACLFGLNRFFGYGSPLIHPYSGFSYALLRSVEKDEERLVGA